MSAEFIADDRFRAGLTYPAYLEVLAQAAARPATPDLSQEERDRIAYTQLNLQRTRRINKTYEVSADLRRALKAITTPQRWLVITEPWCGDSSQCLPYLAKMAEAGPRIELRLLLRDRNLDVMDRYLTDGKRGIPILVAADERGRELLRWGPRPRAAAELFARAKAAGEEKPQILEQLHLWYGRDRGRAIEAEMVALVAGTTAG